jgi:hypothetical protein
MPRRWVEGRSVSEVLGAREVVTESVVVASAIRTRIPSTARTTSAVTIKVNMGRLLL